MAMLPFCGYNMGDYFRHWIGMGAKISNLPKIFHVNWFRTDNQGNFLWPGFRENLRVIKWILERIEGKIGAAETPIGYVPKKEDLYLDGINVKSSHLEELLSVDKQSWLEEAKSQEEFFRKFGSSLPEEILEEHSKLKKRLNS